MSLLWLTPPVIILAFLASAYLGNGDESISEVMTPMRQTLLPFYDQQKGTTDSFMMQWDYVSVEL
jgi:hypothetical protein